MPVQLDLIGYKKRKRSIGDKVFRFKSFGEQGYPAELDEDGCFVHNVKALMEYGQVETISSSDGSASSWSFHLEISRHPPLYILLFVVEESINTSINPQCKHCVYVGWAENLICNKKYHFLLPLKETMMMSEEISVSSWVNNNYNYSDIFKGTRRQGAGHAMHGVFHSNGFGHLLCINGLEMGSKLSGSQIMDFWDRLCTALRARKVSVNDVSQKRGMELRLLHGLGYGEPWFGRWGYLFGRGTYGVTLPLYMKALEALRTMPLLLLTRSTLTDDDVPIIVSRYQSLSNHSLVTVGDLFHFMLHYESQLPKDQNSIPPHQFNLGAVSMEASSRWSMKRIEMATEVIVDALKRVQFRWISRQEVRDMARAYIGDTGLLDFVLKSLGNHIVGNFLVRRCLNPVTKVLEYCLEDISGGFNNQLEASVGSAAGGMRLNNNNNGRVMKKSIIITRVQLMRDVLYLYKSIFGDAKQQQVGKNGCTMPQLASRVVLDSKYLIKDYYNNTSSEDVVVVKEGRRLKKVYCSITLLSKQQQQQEEGIVPFECIVLEENATMGEVKVRAESRFRELYWGLRRVVVGNDDDDDDGVVVEAGSKIVVEGRGRVMDDDGVGIMIISEGGGGGMMNCDCCCGTKEDDGERMVGCDICEVWQHTRCLHIPDDQQLPHIFLCNRCDQQILLSPSSF